MKNVVCYIAYVVLMYIFFVGICNGEPVIREYQTQSDVFFKDYQRSTSSWEELHWTINYELQKYKSWLNEEWGLDGDVLRAAFFMNVVNNLWAFGYEEGEKGKKCWNNYKESLRIDVVCCDEYAIALKKLFDIAGIENKKVKTKDDRHIYNKISIGNKHYIFDPSYNFFIALNDKDTWHLFPYNHSNPNSKLYVKRRGIRRIGYLLSKDFYDN